MLDRSETVSLHPPAHKRRIFKRSSSKWRKYRKCGGVHFQINMRCQSLHYYVSQYMSSKCQNETNSHENMNIWICNMNEKMNMDWCSHGRMVTHVIIVSNPFCAIASEGTLACCGGLKGKNIVFMRHPGAIMFLSTERVHFNDLYPVCWKSNQGVFHYVLPIESWKRGLHHVIATT